MTCQTQREDRGRRRCMNAHLTDEVTGFCCCLASSICASMCDIMHALSLLCEKSGMVFGVRGDGHEVVRGVLEVRALETPMPPLPLIAGGSDLLQLVALVTKAAFIGTILLILRSDSIVTGVCADVINTHRSSSCI